MKMKTKQLVAAITLVGSGIMFPSELVAQQDYPVMIKRIPADETFTRIDDELRVGDFVFAPTFSFTEYYDSNIFATPDQEQSDSISEIKVSLNLDSDWEAHALGMEAGIDVARYAEYDTENSVDNWISLNGKYDANKSSQLLAGASLINDHEDRASPNEAYGDEPTQFSEFRINAGYVQKMSQHSLSLALNSVDYDFDDVATTTGTIDNDTRDYTHASYGLRFNYALTPRYFIFAQATRDDRDYDMALDSNGFDRDSDGNVYALGLKLVRSAQWQGEVFAGQISQSYDDNRFDKITEADFGANIRGLVSDNIALNLIVDRSLEETTLADASSFLYTQYALRADQRFSSQWFGNLNASRGDADYQSLSREDSYKDYGIGVSYSPEEGLAFSADYRAMQRSSSEPADAYRRKQILLSVSARM